MRLAILVVSTMIFLWIVSEATSYSFALIDTPSDFGMLLGQMLLALTIGGAIFAVITFFIPRVQYLIRNGWLSTVALVLLSMNLGGCAQRVDPGHVGIKVNYYGEDRGVQNMTIVTGYAWYNPFTTRIFEYPTYVQTAIWSRDEQKGVNEEITYNSKDGMTFSADISLSYELQAPRVPSFYVKFRTDDLRVFTHGFLRNIARDAFNELAPNYTAEELIGGKKEELLARVRVRVNDQTDDYGVNLVQLGYTSAPRPPSNILDAINAKIEAIQNAQRIENEVAQTKAQAQKDVAEAEGRAAANIAQAKGQAIANKALAESLSPQLIEWRRLQLMADAIQKWDGARPLVESSGEGMLMTLDSLRSQKVDRQNTTR